MAAAGDYRSKFDVERSMFIFFLLLIPMCIALQIKITSKSKIQNQKKGRLNFSRPFLIKVISCVSAYFRPAYSIYVMATVR